MRSNSLKAALVFNDPREVEREKSAIYTAFNYKASKDKVRSESVFISPGATVKKKFTEDASRYAQYEVGGGRSLKEFSYNTNNSISPNKNT